MSQPPGLQTVVTESPVPDVPNVCYKKRDTKEFANCLIDRYVEARLTGFILHASRRLRHSFLLFQI